MKKILTLSLQISSEIFDNVRWLSIHFVFEAVVHLCLGLSLLKENLIENLTVMTPDNKFRICLESGDFRSSSHRSEIKKNDENCVSLLLSSDELDFWLHFFLKYYRDRFAEIDHIDLEIEGNNSRQSIYLTLKVDKVAPQIVGI